jgi:hypothetical protein
MAMSFTLLYLLVTKFQATWKLSWVIGRLATNALASALSEELSSATSERLATSCFE